MKTIRYIVPYFGKLPEEFQLWLTTCKTNPSVEWMLFTDDRTDFDYPDNVSVSYCSFEEMKARFQSNYDFEICIQSLWHISLFKPAYGEIFREELKGADFWGHCDVDMMWGNIRKFLTDEILSAYDRIGFQGHSTLYRNTAEVNARYRTEFEGMTHSYKEIFSGASGWSFDEKGMDEIYEYLGINCYTGRIFAHLRKYTYGFSLGFMPADEEYKNEYQLFEWDAGTLKRYYFAQNNLFSEEFMYIHFFCRPMTYAQKIYSPEARYIIAGDCVRDFAGTITGEYVVKYGKSNKWKYFAKSLWKNRHKLTPDKLRNNIKRFIHFRKMHGWRPFA